MRTRHLAAVALLACTVLGACGDDDADESSAGYSVASSLRQIPAAALADASAPLIMSGDLDRATELAGVDRPSDPGARDAHQWVEAVTRGRADGEDTGVAVMPLDGMRVLQADQMDEIDDELGWSLVDVHTYAGVDAPPEHFMSMTGEFDTDELDAAQGDREDGIWSLGGDDFSVDLEDRTPARQLGGSLRTGELDDHVAESAGTPTMRAWLDGDETLADDESLVAVAKALDEHDVYSAALLSDPPSADDTIAEAIDDADLEPFEVLGIGSAFDEDDGPQVVLAYLHGDEDAAEHNAEALETLFDDGESATTRQPWTEFFTVDDVDVDGEMVTVTLDLAEGRSPALVLQMVLRQEPFAVSP